MRVAHILWGFCYGGVETMLVNIANAQVEMNLDVSIVIINDLVEPHLVECLSKNVRIVRINRKIGSKNIAFIRKFNKELDTINPDIIHLHHSALQNLISKRRLDLSCCFVTLHAMPIGKMGANNRWVNLFQNIVLHQNGNVRRINNIHNIISISKSVAAALMTNYSISSDVIYNGIVTKMFRKRDGHVPGKIFNIIQVSRLEHEKKGQDLLIHALRILKDNGIKVNVTFVGEGESIDYLVNLTSSLSLNDDVTFIGAKSQNYVAQNLANFDLFVQPSRMEGFGLTVAEAMAAQVPVLVSMGQGPSEVTEGMCYGWTFQNGDYIDLATQISFICRHYHKAVEKAQIALLHVCKCYDVSVTAKCYIEKYLAAINNKK